MLNAFTPTEVFDHGPSTDTRTYNTVPMTVPNMARLNATGNMRTLEEITEYERQGLESDIQVLGQVEPKGSAVYNIIDTTLHIEFCKRMIEHQKRFASIGDNSVPMTVLNTTGLNATGNMRTLEEISKYERQRLESDIQVLGQVEPKGSAVYDIIDATLRIEFYQRMIEHQKRFASFGEDSEHLE
jgi:hypothetical protein